MCVCVCVCLFVCLFMFVCVSKPIISISSILVCNLVFTCPDVRTIFVNESLLHQTFLVGSVVGC